MTESRFSVTHVRMTSDRPFADVQAAFEQRLGRFSRTSTSRSPRAATRRRSGPGSRLDQKLEDLAATATR